jgi:hypothetical protein
VDILIKTFIIIYLKEVPLLKFALGKGALSGAVHDRSVDFIQRHKKLFPAPLRSAGALIVFTRRNSGRSSDGLRRWLAFYC